MHFLLGLAIFGGRTSILHAILRHIKQGWAIVYANACNSAYKLHALKWLGDPLDF